MGAFLDHLGAFPVHSGRIQRNSFISLAFLVEWVRESWAQTAEHTGIFRHLKCLWHKSIMKYETFLYCQTNIALSCQQPARWLRFLQIFNPQREFKSCALLPYFNYPLHKRSSCIKSDLGRVHNTGYLHNSTPFSKPASSGSIFHASKLPVNPQNWEFLFQHLLPQQVCAFHVELCSTTYFPLDHYILLLHRSWLRW